MHGFNSGSTFLVNAEVDSMGGVVDGGVGIGTKPSPRRVAIEKAQAELRLEYDVREERRRELEFLEKGGNPLDFKFGNAAALSVQSTSHTDQHPDQFLTSEAKGSFALTASPHGDSVESSGRLGVTAACEPNSADNFDGENELLESERKSTYPARGSITPSEHSSQLDGSLNVKESEESPIFHPKKGQAYRRRNRSRTSRDGPRSSSTDMAARGGHSTLPSRHGMSSKPTVSENQLEVESDGTHAVQSSTTSRASEVPEVKHDVSNVKGNQEELQSQSIKVEEAPVATSIPEPDLVEDREEIVPPDVECSPTAAGKSECNVSAAQINEFTKMNGDAKCSQTERLADNGAQATKGLDSESSCTPNSFSVDGNGNIDNDLHTNLKAIDRNGAPKERSLSLGEKEVSKEDKTLNEKHVTDPMDTDACIKEDKSSIGHQDNGFADEDRAIADRDRSSPRVEVKAPSTVVEQGANDHVVIKADVQAGPSGDPISKLESSCHVTPLPSLNPVCPDLSRSDLSFPTPISQPQVPAEDQPKVVDKAHEDRRLEEARIIEAKRKRIAELSIGLLPREHRRKSHWDFVLEEMAWLANDFAQERLWKMSAAAQICRRVATVSKARLEEQNLHLKQKAVAHTLAKAVMEFWHSAGLHIQNVKGCLSEKDIHDASSKADESVVASNASRSDEENVFGKDLHSLERKQDPAVHGYAVRFLQLHCTSTSLVTAGNSRTCNVASDIDLPEVLWQDQFTEENLFYVVPPGAMEMYRRSIESCLSESERAANILQEEVDTSMYDAAAEFGYQETDYEEDEGENLYFLSGAFDTGKASKKKRKNMKSYTARSFESGGDFGYAHCLENRSGNPQSTLMGKRPANSLHVGPIPTKRMRTASRQRVVGPFHAASAGVALAPCRADASSGDTSSFQDDQSTLHGGSVLPRGSEVDSGMDLEKQCTYDSSEIPAKPKKKKKIKHQAAAYDQRWQLDSTAQNEQKDHVKKRLDSHQLESNGNGAFFGQQAKKPKIMKQSLDNSFDNAMPMSGSVASPVASQMSNMSNQSRIIKLIGGRDRGRKAKSLKVPAGQPGSGSPWSLFEDQALVVLVHDMGPNWELVSDAINSTLQFKCIFRMPQECKERHKILMDRTSGDGADSAEDSGSSQPYPSTLPGIPKGSARQLFQRLQGPMEEDTIKSHFEKIILIGQQLHYRRKQNDIQDLKQIVPVHGSHMVALSQVFPNNVNGGVLTPLDLCDIAASSQDVLPLGYQGAQPGGLPLSNQGTIPPMHASTGLNTSLQGLQSPPGMGIGNNLASPSSQFNGPGDARYSVPRSASLPIEEQQRLQQYNNMLPGRNFPPSNLASAGALSGNDRGARMLPGGNGVGVIAGTNRSMSIPRQGLHSSSVLNSGSMLASGMGGIPNDMNMHSGAASGQGNSMFRPRDGLHMARPAQSSEHQTPMMLPEMQMQGNQSNSPGVSPFGGMSSGFPNQTASPPVQTYSGHHQHQQQHPHVLGGHHPHLSGSNHSAATPHQQALLRMRMQRLIQRQQQQQQQQQHQHQQLPASSSSMTHVQSPAQLPVSSSLQNSSLLQSQASSLNSSSPMTPVSSQPQQQPKHAVPPHGIGRSVQSGVSGMMNNQVGKQRQRPVQQLQQQYNQSGRQHPQQRQSSQAQQQAKLLKGMGRGNTLMHQNIPTDASHLNGLSANPGAQAAEKGEQSGHLMQSQGLYPGSASNLMQTSKPLAPLQNSSHTQPQKSYANTVPATSKQAQRIPSAPAVAASNQGLRPSLMSTHNHQQLQGQSQPPKVVSQPQPGPQRPLQQSRQVMNADLLTKSLADHGPVEQQFANSTLKSNTSGVPPCVDSTSVIPISSSASSASQKAQESLSDSSMPNSSAPSGSINSPPLSNSLGNEPISSGNQGLGQRQLSGNLMPHGRGVGAQWQQSQTPPLQPIMPQKQSQQQLQQLEQSVQRVPQQPQIQAGQGNMISKTDSRLE